MDDQAAPAPPAARSPKQADLTTGPITRTLVMFSLPVLGSSVLQSLNGSINALWVGRLLGEEALTATTNANLILFFLIGSVFGVGLSATILVGQAVGARDTGMLKRVVGTTATFFLFASIAVALFGFAFTDAILGWMGTPAGAAGMAASYLRVIFIAVPFIYMFNFFMMILRGAGDARTPFRFMALAVVLDIGFNPLLILGVGPLPQMGIAGAAVSTLIGQAISLAAMVWYLYWRKSEVRLKRDELHYLKPDRKILIAAVVKGLPMGLQMAVISISAIIMMSMINAYGAATAAAYGVAMQIWTYVQMPAMSIGAAVSSMAAQNVGAQKWDRVERTARSGVMVNVVLTGGLVALLYLIDPFVVGLFLPGQTEALALAQHINNVSGWAFIAFGVTFVLFGVVRSTGATMPPLIILFISLFVIRIAFAQWLEPFWGADAIWWSFPAGMIASMLLTIAYYRWGKWREARMMEPAREVEDAPNTGAGAPALDLGLVAENEEDVR